MQAVVDLSSETNPSPPPIPSMAMEQVADQEKEVRESLVFVRREQRLRIGGPAHIGW